MTPRSLRRAAERKRQKLARKAERAAAAFASADTSLAPGDDFEPETALCFGEPDLDAPAAVSAAQLRANRANAQLSTGPTSPQGKAISSTNAVKTALTGRTVLLPTDDAAEYERHIRAFEADLKPVGPQERELVQSIADTFWRLRRIPCLESAIFAKGHMDLANAYPDLDPARRFALIEMESWMKYEKQLRNLQLQEARLARRREKEMAELRGLQQQRRAERNKALDETAKHYLQALTANQPFVAPQTGFEFSTAEIENFLEARMPGKLASLQSRQAGIAQSDGARITSQAA